MPNPQQWQRIKEIVGAALEREISQRSAFLDEACSNDSSLRAEVDSLLSAYRDAGPLSQGSQTTELADGLAPLRSIGPYQLIQLLGEGGMGQVWLAEQTSPVRRKVALKLIKAGMYDDSVLRRFQTERQSLAIMDHPAIAKVFDAGATPDGQPYFVMEYVPGLPLTEYCDKKRLKIRERLELFIHTCEGVQHAHQKALIHRDLKPANILVVEVDGHPQPRIIDFGLAKSVTPFFGGDFGQTRVGAFVGTPGYMSPEQADPGAQDIDTRTDVYSLGVILYELLTGSLPFDPSIWKDLRFEEMLRHLREDEPLRPSTKVSSGRDASSPPAAARGTQPNQLASLLRGDLDWITLKALDKDRNRRYGSPSDLAADLSRYLNNQPVIARPASPGYVVRKYVRRHRYAVAFASTLVLLLAGFAILQAIQLRRITRERDRANRITDFMTNMFKVSDPSESRGNTITAREILDKASKDTDTGLAKDPELQAQMMDVMGNVYESLGLYPQAESLLERAVAIRLRVLGQKSPDTLDSMNSLTLVFEDQGRYTDAEKLDRETFDLRRKVLGAEHPDTLTSRNNLGVYLRDEGHYAEAEKLDAETLDLRRRVLGPLHVQTLLSMDNLAQDMEKLRKYPEAEKLEAEALEIQRRVLGPEHRDTLGSMTNLANTLRLERKFVDSEKLSRETLEISKRVFGPEHLRTLIILNNLAITIQQQGRYAESEQLNRQALEIKQRTLGPEHPDTLASMNNLSIDLRHEGKLQEAEQLNRQAFDLNRRVLGPEHLDTIGSMDNLMNCLAGLHRYAEAEQLARQILEIKSRVFGPDDISTADAAYDLGTFLAIEGKRDEAISVLGHVVDHGLRPEGFTDIQTNPDLKSLRSDPRFQAIVADAKEKLAEAQKSK